MEHSGDGYFHLLVPKARAGMRYHFVVDQGDLKLPDPVSRFQPEGPHGPSEIIDPTPFQWTDAEWPGCPRTNQVIYEMHVGTFTREGTFRAAQEQLPELAKLGVTLIEMMPVAEFSGTFGWGYDGVNLFAPTHNYGRPDDLRAFVDAAHANGIGVILDVVYNHFGPDGNYIGYFSQNYFTSKYANEWGDAINFDSDNAHGVREFFISNARYWVSEFHFDGLRLDATQSIHDSSQPHVLQEICQAARQAAHGRAVYIVGENEPQNIRCLRSASEGGHELDALWNDDFHHSAIVALTGNADGYYFDYRGTPQEFVSSAKYSFLFQGQRYAWQKQCRGTSTRGFAANRFVNFLQNHDQVANSAKGLRIHELVAPGTYRAATAVMLLFPQTPMLFQGQEFASSAPFLYFADHPRELAEQVRKGRAEFLTQFRGLKHPLARRSFADPESRTTFEACVLDFGEREKHRDIYDLHIDLLRLRREDPVLSGRDLQGVDGAVLGESSFLIRFFSRDELDRVLIVNLGREHRLYPQPEPLLASPAGKKWRGLWSSENPKYGATCYFDGIAHEEEAWTLPGFTAFVLAPVES